METGQKLRDVQLLHDLPDGTTLCCVSTSVAALEFQLGELESPGCQCQKYLRAYEGVASSDLRVTRSFWVFAVLAQTAANVWVGESSAEARKQIAIPVNQIAGAALMMLDKLWRFGGSEATPARTDASLVLNPDLPVTQEHPKLFEAMSLGDLESLITAHYSIEAHEKLLSWVLESEDGSSIQTGKRSMRFRVALAELNQITVRRTIFLLESGHNERQTSAYVDLLRVISCSSGVRCWA